MTSRPKRPRDFSQAAKLVIDIATGQVEPPETKTPLTKKQAAELGGRKRAISLTAKERKEIASKAARQRWRTE
jgi:hypothetical protein